MHDHASRVLVSGRDDGGLGIRGVKIGYGKPTRAHTHRDGFQARLGDGLWDLLPGRVLMGHTLNTSSLQCSAKQRKTVTGTTGNECLLLVRGQCPRSAEVRADGISEPP